MTSKFKELKVKKIEKIKVEPKTQYYSIQFNLQYLPTHKQKNSSSNLKEKQPSTTVRTFTFSTTKKGEALEKYIEKRIEENSIMFLQSGVDNYDWEEVEIIGNSSNIQKSLIKKSELKKVKLGHLSYSYPYLKDADVIFTKEGNCITDYLYYELKNKPYFKKMTKSYIETYFKDEKNFLQIEKFINEHGHISICAINPLNKVFHKYQAENSVITLTFMINNNHIYPILNSDIKKSINKKDYIDINEFVYNVDYTEHQYLEDNDEIDMNKNVILFNKDNLFEEATKVMKETNMIVDKILYDDCNRIISFVNPNTKQIYETTKQYKDRTQIIEDINKVYELNMKFENQPFSQISKELFNSKYGNTQMIKSHLNNDVYDALNNYSISPYISKLREDFDISVMEAMDISKSYSSALLNNKHDYAIYSIFDTIEPFDGNLTNGEYYVNIPLNLCNNTINLPLGFYPIHMIHYALDKKVITIENIKYQIKPKTVLKYDYFKQYVEDAYNKLPNGKELINHIIGTFGIKQSKQVNGFVSNDWETVCSMYHQEIADNKEVFIHTFENLHFFRSIKTDKLFNTSLPIYRHIITHGIINLCNLYYDLNPKYVISYNTDCIVYVKNHDLKTFITDDKGNIYNKTQHHNEIKDMPNHINNNTIKTELDKVGKYRPEEPKPRGIIGKKILRDDYEYIKETPFNIYDETTEILKLNSAVVQGIAGAGKSHLIKNIIENKPEDLNILILCFTNVAVQNLKQRIENYEDIYTFDTFYNEEMPFREKINKTKKYNMIIVDEYSMTPLKHMTMLYNVKKVFENMRLFFFGDKNQCLGVNEFSYSYDFIDTKPFKEMIEYNYYECKYKEEFSRYDLTTLNALTHFLNKGSMDKFMQKQNDDLFINICKYNNTRIEINEERFKVHSKDKDIITFSKNCKIYIDMPIICIKTNKIDKIYNSERFTITNIDKDNETITLNDNRVISFLTYENYFDMAFCFTVYKIQGATINEPYQIYDINSMTKRELYTALSRTKKYEYINFEKVKKNKIFVNCDTKDIKKIVPEPFTKKEIHDVKVKEIKETKIDIERLQEKVKMPKINEYTDRFQFTYEAKNYTVRHNKTGKEEAMKKIISKREELMNNFFKKCILCGKE